MTRTLAEGIAWAQAHPKPSSPGGGPDGGVETDNPETWDQKCGSFLVRAFLLPYYRTSAYRAAMASGWLNTDLSQAPAAAFIFFDIAGENNGHVGVTLTPGGYNMLSAASNQREYWGTAMGVNSAEAYARAKGARIMGWADNYAGSKITGSSQAPLPNTSIETEDDMKLYWLTSGTGILSTDIGATALPNPQVYNLFYRVIKSNQLDSPFVNGAKPDIFLQAEQDIMEHHKRLINSAIKAETAIDPVKLASALSDALGDKLVVDAEVEFDEEYWVKLAAAYDTAVPRITRAILKQQGELLAAVK